MVGVLPAGNWTGVVAMPQLAGQACISACVGVNAYAVMAWSNALTSLQVDVSYTYTTTPCALPAQSLAISNIMTLPASLLPGLPNNAFVGILAAGSGAGHSSTSTPICFVFQSTISSNNFFLTQGGTSPCPLPTAVPAAACAGSGSTLAWAVNGSFSPLGCE